MEHVDTIAQAMGMEKLGPWSESAQTDLIERLYTHTNRLSSLVAVFESLALHAVMARDHGDRWVKIVDLPTKVDMNLADLLASIAAVHSVDGPDRWLDWDPEKGSVKLLPRFIDKETIVDRLGEDSMLTHDGREKAAKDLLDSVGLDYIKPLSYATSKPAGDDTGIRTKTEEMLLSIVNRKVPTWAGARGFNESYKGCLVRARLVKNSGKRLAEFDGLTQMYCYVGANMYDTHVMTIKAAQVLSLPDLTDLERREFIREIHLPFEPSFYIDFSADGYLPTFEINKDGGDDKIKLVQIAGCLMTRLNDDVLFIPHFIYDSVAGQEPIAPGAFVINQDQSRENFVWAGQEYPYVDREKGMAIVAHTDVLDDNPDLGETYAEMIERGTDTALRVLFFLEAANVETVPQPLERRIAKRAAKRNWKIPDSVRVVRPRRRTTKAESTGESRDYSHQWTVRGFYRHVTKGSHVRCKVCQGKPLEGVGCSACNSTGLDPEKTKPCARTDITTGELTCPNGCRREWTPDHVRGPEDAPLVVKTYDMKAA